MEYAGVGDNGLVMECMLSKMYVGARELGLDKGLEYVEVGDNGLDTEILHFLFLANVLSIGE